MWCPAMFADHVPESWMSLKCAPHPVLDAFVVRVEEDVSNLKSLPGLMLHGLVHHVRALRIVFEERIYLVMG